MAKQNKEGNGKRQVKNGKHNNSNRPERRNEKFNQRFKKNINSNKNNKDSENKVHYCVNPKILLKTLKTKKTNDKQTEFSKKQKDFQAQKKKRNASFLKTTRKGQPVLGARMKILYNQIQKNCENHENREFQFPTVDALQRRRHTVAYSADSQSDNDGDGTFQSYIVIEFEKNVNRHALHWIVDKIRKKKIDGGAELLIQKQPSLSDEKGLIIHISATKLRLLELADEIGFTKQTENGMRNFNIGCLDDFVYEDNMTIDDILTPAEKQYVIKYALENIKAKADERHIPGYASVFLYHGQSIIQAAISEELISMSSLHDKKYMKQLGTEWWNVKKILQPQPIEKIRFYFGDAIGIYFSFVGKDPITGKMMPHYPVWKTMCQVYFVSVPVILICSIGAVFMTLCQFWFEDYLTVKFGYESYIVLIPSICQSIFVATLTVFYDRFATYLTAKENHRTQSHYERYRVNKLIVLEFVNNFFCLFYIAFVKRDMKMLQNQLMTQMIILQFVQSAQEFLIPKLKQKYYLWCEYRKGEDANAKKKRDNESFESVFEDLNIQELGADDSRIYQYMRESAKENYETYEDYLELYIQFGYVVLFSSVAPLAAFWALLNNFFEIRLDAYKLCKTFRRPMAKRAKNTGAWQRAFEVLACLSIMTNCGILYLSPQVRDLTHTMTAELKLIVFVGLEHFLLLLAWIIHKAIPDRPKSVQIALARADYESKQAQKREVMFNENL
ncbi:CLUMA_CG014020, isoform A [Clunio marinus]|uniref:Anoctamin n=1 Tax=Clunio marinus TaxID=568069 RepID=A0A1J1IKJ4_9DIPT|nr:CLUMA_CG014020, isoform A [Clunio marinus]